jgi:predicted DNA-binding transcriptional regulator YafY
LRWRATVSGTIEIRLWILSWGADVEVVAPPGLRDDVADTLRRALVRYG